ncbi:TIGR03905 family TSCPD domain-containing protein [uncultured Eubacterium sp.]|uniref:TIGR03905 family TSCPD domain-containing protein n=1 Tax=uncultured Eubacterium sp. TaxID=165185 RepID=UPI0015AC72C2|nr:TIGR03905 family TSCPD domain-containing protein [uncultured Eubacterium sp.]
MKRIYSTRGTCSRQIIIEINDDQTIGNVEFIGGCSGNLKGISALVKGKKPDEIISALKGINCNYKGTSCPDQLARALEEIKEELN